jgi:hypothetical protein
MIHSLLLGVVLLLFVVFLPIAFAQESLPLIPLPSPTPVEYVLPFPGILPDHPLYMIKRLRDQLLLTLISNPLKKVEFYILLSNKHLNMSLFLLDKKKEELAFSTVTKSVAYLTDAHQLLKAVSSETDAVANVKHRLQDSLRKHKEVLESMDDRTTDKSHFVNLVQQVAQLQEAAQEK